MLPPPPVAAPPLVLDGTVIGVFLLANAIIIWICAPRFWKDVLAWRRGHSSASASRMNPPSGGTPG
jgi:hypothetical protein